jgi:hypothetical protein
MIGITLRPGARIAGVDGCAARQALLDLTGGQPTTVLLQLTGVRSISRQAMGFHSAATTVTAFAVVGDSPLDRVIARRGLPQPPCPSRYFYRPGRGNQLAANAGPICPLADQRMPCRVDFPSPLATCRDVQASGRL